MAALIIYYSRAGENYFGGAYKYVDKGNTEIAAEILAKETGADMFKVEQEQPYSDVYNTCIEQAKKDKNCGARPAVKSIPNIDGYDTIYLGYPNYWGTCPMAVFTVLEKLDFSGKTIKPFCTHEGSGLGSSESDIKRLAQGASVVRGLAINGSAAGNSLSHIKKWIK